MRRTGWAEGRSGLLFPVVWDNDRASLRHTDAGALHTIVSTAVAMVVLGSDLGRTLFCDAREIWPEFGMIANSAIMFDV